MLSTKINSFKRFFFKSYPYVNLRNVWLIYTIKWKCLYPLPFLKLFHLIKSGFVISTQRHFVFNFSLYIFNVPLHKTLGTEWYLDILWQIHTLYLIITTEALVIFSIYEPSTHIPELQSLSTNASLQLCVIPTCPHLHWKVYVYLRMIFLIVIRKLFSL
jgi:hypothetical protein